MFAFSTSDNLQWHKRSETPHTVLWDLESEAQGKKPRKSEQGFPPRLCVFSQSSVSFIRSKFELEFVEISRMSEMRHP